MNVFALKTDDFHMTNFANFVTDLISHVAPSVFSFTFFALVQSPDNFPKYLETFFLLLLQIDFFCVALVFSCCFLAAR